MTHEWAREPLQAALTQGGWKSSSERLTIAFMMGYDVSRRTNIKRKKEDET